jgi:hypothetical protein
MKTQVSTSYKLKYKRLLDDIARALAEGTVLSDEFRQEIEQRRREETGEDSTAYEGAPVGDIQLG